MTETSELEGLVSGNLSSSSPGNFELYDQKGAEKVSVSDQINSLQYTNMKSDSFTVDMERFAHLTPKDVTLNSRINLQRSLSRKGSQRWGEKKMNIPNADNDRDSGLVATSSPRAALVGGTTPEKAMVVTVGTADQAMNPQVHHQITIVTGNVAAPTTTTTTTTERRLGGKRFSFRRNSSSSSWTNDPRRILFFFATLSSMGTMLLIYFTLSMSKLSADANSLN